jgi:probable HAF family extracellular repeat protein
MKPNVLLRVSAMAFSTALLLAPSLIAQQRGDEHRDKGARHRYRVVDLGTFGGSNSYYFLPYGPSVSRNGVVVGGADTTEPDPDYPFCFGNACLAVHAFRWRNGKLRDLGALPNGANSGAIYANDSGLIAGFGDDGLVDPFTGTPDLIPVAWHRGRIIEIGTFGGSFGFPNAINNRGEIVGVALNANPDDFSMLGLGPTETRAFLWREGALKDLGTLGGPDAWAAYINEQGQIAGWSYTDSAPNPTTGLPTQHPYLWDKDRMRDLGTLGGTLAVVGSFASPGGGALNNRGQVAGTSNLSGDVNWHPFLWSRGRMRDLGTLGGSNGEAYWINDSGDVVGRTDIPGSTNHHAFLWRKGKMLDLGTAPGWPCSTAVVINAREEVIIDTGICGKGGGPGYLWRDGVSYDLNGLVPADTKFFIGDVFFINDRGEIAAVGVQPNGDVHDLLLVPCEEDGHEDEAAQTDVARRVPVPGSRPKVLSPAQARTRVRAKP